jgi:protein SCO1/2
MRVRLGSRDLHFQFWRSWLLLAVTLAALVTSCSAPKSGPASAAPLEPRAYAGKGIVREVRPDGRSVVIQHEAIPNYMAAMTMPFRVRETNDVAGVKPGDEVSFRLFVAADESWIDQVVRTGRSSATVTNTAAAGPTHAPGGFYLSDIPDFALTNEFGQPLSLRSFRGRAMAMTFFFTRCPLPEYCPRLTKNFYGAIEKLKTMPNGPTNFHFVSISFDPFDAPLLLRSYGRQYRYDSNHWTFVTGDNAQIKELARGFGVGATPESGVFNHGFSTAIFDATGKLQNMWPIGGDMTDQIVTEIVKGAQARAGVP